jgi:hypothetical protein
VGHQELQRPREERQTEVVAVGAIEVHLAAWGAMVVQA